MPVVWNDDGSHPIAAHLSPYCCLIQSLGSVKCLWFRMMMVPTVGPPRLVLLRPIQSLGVCYFSHCLSMMAAFSSFLFSEHSKLYKANYGPVQPKNSVYVEMGGFLRKGTSDELLPHANSTFPQSRVLRLRILVVGVTEWGAGGGGGLTGCCDPSTNLQSNRRCWSMTAQQKRPTNEAVFTWNEFRAHYSRLISGGQVQAGLILMGHRGGDC